MDKRTATRYRRRAHKSRATVKLHRPTRYWHAGKILFEKDWLRRWF